MSLLKLEKGLKIYYATFKLKYDNKFSIFLEDSGMDEDDLNAEMTSDAEDFTLSDFDDDFPLYPEIDNEEKRSLEIFRICNNCYKYGEPPIILHPPRGIAEKIPFFHWYQDMNVVRMKLKFLSENLLNSAVVDFENKETFKLEITSETFYVSVYKEYELKFNFRHAINPDSVQYRKVILGKMLEFVFEKYEKNKYWNHLLMDYHKKMFKQHCKVDWENFLDKDDAVKKEKGILGEDDEFEKYKKLKTSDDGIDDEKKSIESQEEKINITKDKKEMNKTVETNDDVKQDENKTAAVDQKQVNTETVGTVLEVDM